MSSGFIEIVAALAVAALSYPLVAFITATAQRRKTAAQTTEAVSGAAARAVESLGEALDRLQMELEQTSEELSVLRKENNALREDVRRLTRHNDELREDVKSLAQRLYDQVCPSCGHRISPE